MNNTPERPTERASRSSLDAAHLDGHTIESLSEYLDRGRTPRDPAIESSPAAQNALAALSRLRAVAPKILVADADADEFAPRNENWIKRILDHIGVQAHAGRDIPIEYDAEGAALSISEGAVRSIVRDVGDDVDGLLVERCRLEGDVETPGAPVEVQVEVSTFEGVDPATAITDFRDRVERALSLHTDLHVVEIAVRVRDTDLTDEEVDSR